MNIDLKYIIDDMYYCIISSIFFFLVLLLIQISYCSIYNLIIFFLLVLELFYKDHGDSIRNHGMLNIQSLFIFIFLGEIISIIIILLIKTIKRKKYLSFTLVISILLFILILISYKYKDEYYCKNWDRSLNNSYINNDRFIYPCSIEIPKKRCFISIIGPFLDFSKILNIKCEKRKEKEKYFLKEISNLKNSPKNIKRIGYPLTIGENEEIIGRPAKYSKKLFEYVKNNLIDMDKKESLNEIRKIKKVEVFVDYSNNSYGELKIEINYNKSLSLKRKSLEINKNSNNIIFIFLDNLSRVHFYRQYKKTSKFLKNFFNYKGFSPNNKSEQSYHGFEFLKYHKFNGATLGNAIPMFSGVYYEENNTMISIVRDLKKNGYITCNVQDVCHKELMDINNISGYTYVEFDHEYASPSCDPNIYHYGFALFNGENGILRKCLYGKESFEQALIYAKNFWDSYKDNKKFLRIVNTYAHEYIGEKSKYADDSLFNFLNEFYMNNRLENTILFIAGDHGFALMGIYKIINSEDYDIEFQLPIFILIIPDIKNCTYESQYLEISKNQQNFITAFDIYYTIRNILYGEDYKKRLPSYIDKENGESLFKYINPQTRICNKYKKMLICKCKM